MLFSSSSLHYGRWESLESMECELCKAIVSNLLRSKALALLPGQCASVQYMPLVNLELVTLDLLGKALQVSVLQSCA